jgi:Glycosyltransferase WbsX
VTRHTRWATKYKRPLRFEYADVVEESLNDIPNEPGFLPQILPGWDDTPRYGQHGVVYDNSTPELFARHLAKAVAVVKDRPHQEAIIFLKAWNEWAEGNYLEPDMKHGHGYLDAMRRVLGLS